MAATIKYICAATMLAACSLAQGADRGIYVGAGVGSASSGRGGYDNSTQTYQLFAGVKNEGFGLELGYVDLGKFKKTSNTQDYYSVDGVRLNALGEMFLSKGVYGYGTFGFYNWSLDNNANGNSNSGTSVALGLGLRVMLGDNFFGRGGVEHYNDIDGEKSNLLSLNLGYQF